MENQLKNMQKSTDLSVRERLLIYSDIQKEMKAIENSMKLIQTLRKTYI